MLRNQAKHNAPIIFVTGTDTDVGKTVVATTLLHALANAGYRTAALKPIAAGAQIIARGSEAGSSGNVSSGAGASEAGPSDNNQLANSDAIQLQTAATELHPYEDVNPYLFADPIAPHIAAANENSPIDLPACIKRCQTAIQSDVDFVVVEGAGGWLVPLNDTESMADLAVALGSQVILVVGIKLGCINHALLTVAAIERSGVPLLGWVANYLQADMPAAEANITSLKARIKQPLLGKIPFNQQLNPALLATCLDIPALVKVLC